MSKALTKTEMTLYSIALVKSYNYSQEYNPYSGQLEDKEGYPYLKQGYIDGFIAGFTYRLTGDKDL
jgi:hypothetical protein